MTREEALKRISELSCAYQHIRMTECPHCAKEVEMLLRDLMEMKEKGESHLKGEKDDRIKLFRDGDNWYALYGENLQEGKSAFIKATTEYGWNDPARLDALDALREEFPELKSIPFINLEGD